MRSGRLVNAFDLVRLHKYGAMDDDAKPDTPTNRLPSYDAMCEFAVADPDVSALLNKERYERALEAFDEAPDETGTDWMKKLVLNGQGGPERTINNSSLSSRMIQSSQARSSSTYSLSA